MACDLRHWMETLRPARTPKLLASWSKDFWQVVHGQERSAERQQRLAPLIAHRHSLSPKPVSECRPLKSPVGSATKSPCQFESHPLGQSVLVFGILQRNERKSRRLRGFAKSCPKTSNRVGQSRCRALAESTTTGCSHGQRQRCPWPCSWEEPLSRQGSKGGTLHLPRSPTIKLDRC
jgi:hypothetical protein